MIPPCDPVILHNNPQFKRLYEQVTTTFLNPDGSTRADDAQPTRKAVLDDLKECRIRDARTKIKKQTLRRLAFDPDSGLPEEFRDPAAIVYLYLESCPDLFNLPADNDNQPDANALQLLAPDISLFYCNLPDLIEPFSRILLADLQDLRTITDAGTDSDTSSAEAPTGEPSRTRARTRQMTTRSRRAIDSQPFTLASQLNKRIRALRHLQLSELPAARTRMAATAAEVLATRAAVLERMVILLERAKHGAFARATKAKAEHLVTVAQELNGRLKVMKLEISATIHTPEVIAALGRYWDHLERTRERWEERRVAALEELKAYGVEDKDGKGGEENASRDTIRSEHESMKEVYRRYGTLIREIEAKSREIKRMDELC